MITGALEGGVAYIFTSVPQIPPTSILSRALSCGISGMGKSRISVMLGPTLTAASTFSKRCFPPKKLLCGFGGTSASDLPPRAHVLCVSADCLEGNLSDISVVVRVRIQVARGIPDCSVGHANAPIEPRPATQSAQNRNRNSSRHRSAGHRAGVGEVEHGS